MKRPERGALEKGRNSLMEQKEVGPEVVALLEASALNQITTRELATAGKYLLLFQDGVSVAEYKNALSIDPDFIEAPEAR